MIRTINSDGPWGAHEEDRPLAERLDREIWEYNCRNKRDFLEEIGKHPKDVTQVYSAKKVPVAVIYSTRYMNGGSQSYREYTLIGREEDIQDFERILTGETAEVVVDSSN